MKTSLLIFLLSWFSVVGCLRAQTDTAKPAVMVSVEFTVIGWAGDITDLAYRQNGRSHPLEIPGYLRSKAYRYSGPAEMGIYLQKPDKGEKDGAPVATVTFEPGNHHYTVLLASQKGTYQAEAVADDLGKFPLGSARLFNLCPVPMAIRCNKAAAFMLPPHQSEIVKPKDGIVLLTETAYELKGAWNKASDDFVPVRPTEQTSIFFLLSNDKRFVSVDGVTRTIQMVIFREKPPEATPAQPSAPQP